jgi:hypothetical protein
MTQVHVRKRVICAAAAAVLTGITFSVFVAAKPQDYDQRFESTRVASAQVFVSEGAPESVTRAPLAG